MNGNAYNFEIFSQTVRQNKYEHVIRFYIDLLAILSKPFAIVGQVYNLRS